MWWPISFLYRCAVNKLLTTSVYSSKCDHITHTHTAALDNGAGADRVQAGRPGLQTSTPNGSVVPRCNEFHQLSNVDARQCLRSASTSSSVVRRNRLSTVGDGAFPIAAVERSAAERHVMSAPSLTVFKETSEDASL